MCTQASGTKESHEKFEAKIRYMGASSIITIPAKVTRKLALKCGDTIIVELEKK